MSDADVITMVTAVGDIRYGAAARQTILSLLEHTDFRVVVGCDSVTRALVPASARITTVDLPPPAPGRAGPFLAKFHLWAAALEQRDAAVLVHVDADAVLARRLCAVDIAAALGAGQLAMVEQTGIAGSDMDRASFLRHFRDHSRHYLAPDHDLPDQGAFRFHNSGVVIFRARELRNFLHWAGMAAASTDGSHSVGEHMIADQDYLQVWSNILRRGFCTSLDWSWNHCQWWDDGFPRPGARILHLSNFCNGPSFTAVGTMERMRTERGTHDVDWSVLGFVVVTHDSGATIGDCLGVLAGFDGSAIVVVDNASTDSTRLLSSATRLISNATNRGFAAAANQGAASTNAEILCFVNPDCFPTRTLLEEAVATVRDHPRSVVVPRYVHSDGLMVPGRQPGYTEAKIRADLAGPAGRSEPKRRRDPVALDDAGWHWPLAACMVVRASTFTELGGFDDSYFCYMEDVEFGRACSKAGVEIVEIDSPVVHLGGQGSNVPPHRRRELLDRARIRYARRHHGWTFAATMTVMRWMRAVAGAGRHMSRRREP